MVCLFKFGKVMLNCDSNYCYILKSLSFYSSISITQALGSNHDSNFAPQYVMILQLSLS